MNFSFNNSRKTAWAVWLIASLFYAYQYILRVMPSIMAENIIDRFSMNAAVFGQFSGIYYIGYALFHIPIGIALDRFGPKKIVPLSLLITTIGLIPLIFANHWFYPLFGRFLIGLGSSCAILSVFKIVRLAFEESLFPRMLSFSVTIGLLGAIYGGGPVSQLLEVIGYQPTIEVIAVIGLLLAAVSYWLIPSTKNSQQGSVISSIKEVLCNRNVVANCLFAGMMVGPLEGFADVWATLFLRGVYHQDLLMAASLPSMIFIGMCFGSPLLTLIADKAHSYYGTIIGAGVIMTFAFILILLTSLSIPVITGAFFLLGASSAYQILAIYKASTYVRQEVAGLTTAVANMIIMLFGYGFHSAIGFVVNALGGTESPEALQFGIAVIPIALILGTTGFSSLFILERLQKSLIHTEGSY